MAARSTVQKFPNGGSFENFVEEFLLKNIPCLFEESYTHQWRSRRLWVNKQGKPDLNYLDREYGECIVPVADCGREHFSSHPKSEMKMADYLKYWRSLSLQQEGWPKGGEGLHSLLYLKDWHLAKENSSDVFYTTLEYFHNDWLNEVWHVRQDVQDDYRFVYMGPKGTWTPFHADVFRSYSWSANVCGCKEWLLYPPGEEEHLRDSLGHLPFDITSTDLQDKTKYPNAGKACRPIRVIQYSGETIFVPSGWYHQVRNVEDTISINHNWTNAFGLPFMWKHLQSELALVCAELSDCRSMDGWEEQCQLVLRASAGMDYWEFVQFLCVIVLPRLRETRLLLSSSILHGNSSDVLADIEQHLQKITSSSRKLSFFESGMLPVESQHHSLSNVELLTIRDCLTRDSDKSKETNTQHFAALIPLLPENVRTLVLDRDARDLTLERTRAQLVFRLFELTTISSVLDEVLHCVM